MNADDQIKILRNALANVAASDSDSPTSWSTKAKKAVAVVDDALIHG